MPSQEARAKQTWVRNDKILFKTEAVRAVISEARAVLIRNKPGKVSACPSAGFRPMALFVEQRSPLQSRAGLSRGPHCRAGLRPL
eukprot:1160546-Pelagomonas_calceolata.AAC.7